MIPFVIKDYEQNKEEVENNAENIDDDSKFLHRESKRGAGWWGERENLSRETQSVFILSRKRYR